MMIASARKCRVCGCTDANCSQCLERTGDLCYWVGDDLCSACQPTFDERVSALDWMLTGRTAGYWRATEEDEDNAIFASYGDPSDQVRLVATGLSPGDSRVIVQAMNLLPELLEEYYSLKRMYEAKLTPPVLESRPEGIFSV